MVITSPVRAEARLGWTSVALALRLIVAVLPGIGAGLALAFAHASNDSSADRHPAENSSGHRVDQVPDDIEQLPRAEHSPRVNLAHRADEWTTTALVSAPHRAPDRSGETIAWIVVRTVEHVTISYVLERPDIASRRGRPGPPQAVSASVGPAIDRVRGAPRQMWAASWSSTTISESFSTSMWLWALTTALE
jgi:hypothetical protein